MPELPQSICAFCLAPLKPDEAYCCDQCERENASIEMLEEDDGELTQRG
ncbi:hypothetical protein [Yersinia pseudotuberculosis]|nr:hypothetical protein [Yersinia pseudotuberculosis]MBK1423840.1 hypothetical protein [Yersinia pseudotuberculosis]